MSLFQRALPGLLLCASLACSGGATTDEGSPSPSATPTAAPVSFAEVRDTILVPSCGQFAACHQSGGGGLTLTADVAYEQLVSVPSTQIPSMLRVVPGDPDTSYLMWKLTAQSGIVGDEMPPGSSLNDEKLALVEAWIAQGALDN